MHNYETNQKEETDNEFVKSSQNENSNKSDSDNTPDKSKKKVYSFVKKLKNANDKNKNNLVDILTKENEKIEDKKEEDLNNIDLQDNADEHFKINKKLFLKNPFSNLDKYIKFGKSDYLLRDMEYYSKNLAEENKKILNIFPNIYLGSDNHNIQNKIFDELETDIISRKLSKYKYFIIVILFR